MKHSNSGLSFLGGALLGAAAMYIFDPEVGERRRKFIGTKAGDALSETGDRLGDAWSQAHQLGADLIGHARDLGGHLAKNARSGASDVAEKLSDASDQAANTRDQTYGQLKDLQGRVADLGNELIGRARDNVEQARQSAVEFTHPLRHKIARAVDPDHEGHTAGHATAYAGTGLGAVAIGAAAMYFFDPAKGKDRRDYCMSQVSKCVQETGHVCHLACQYVMRVWHGRAGAPDTRLDDRRSTGSTGLSSANNPLDGEELVGRVRAEIGRVLSNPAQVQLMADASGTVTLYGTVPAGELEQVLTAVKAVPGVTAVVDHLEPQSPAEPAPSTTEPATAL
jgi:gas vesicle protein